MLPIESDGTFCDSLESYQEYVKTKLLAQELPEADPQAIKISYLLAQKIIQRIKSDGALPFADFMQMALYEPGLGYYSSGNQKFGAAGDFVTAPEISSLFAQSLARQFAQIFEHSKASILELGAGSGIFAADCMLELERIGALPNKYFILEVSAELKQRQMKTINDIAPHLADRFEWLSQLPDNYKGIVFANEVVDAIPVGLQHRLNNNPESAYVNVNDEGFYIEWQKTDSNLGLELSEGQIVESRTSISAWLKALIASCQEAVFILIDYGDSASSIYNPARKAGTLQQYYRHHKTTSPLDFVGMQDITSSVDFTQLALVADQNECSLIGYSAQSMFLIANDIEHLAQQKMESLDASDTMAPMKVGQQLKQLLMPDEMGETCKVLAFSKNLTIELKGLSLDNRLHKL